MLLRPCQFCLGGAPNARDAVEQDSASLATRLEGLEKDLEALKEANAQETQLLNAELVRTNEVRSKLLLKRSHCDTPLSIACP